jgi:hypothetical protein
MLDRCVSTCSIAGSSTRLLIRLAIGLIVALLIATSIRGAKNDEPQQSDPQTKARVPNIVFILTDDQGYGDMSCHCRITFAAT